MALIAKVLSNNNEEVQLGFEDGTMRTVRAKDIGFLAQVGTKIEVYEQMNGNVKNYAYIKHEESALEKISGNKRKINKVVYMLVTFFLGGLGIHKFITGKVVLGLVYLLLCWTFIPAFVAFVEFILAALKNTDENGMIEV